MHTTNSAARTQPNDTHQPYLQQIASLFRLSGEAKRPDAAPGLRSLFSINFLGLGSYNILPFHNKRASLPPKKKKRRRRPIVPQTNPLLNVASFVRARFFALFPLVMLLSFLLAFAFVNASRTNMPFWASPPTDLTRYVNVFRGVNNGGNMFPGVVPAPFAIVKIGPDCQEDPHVDAYSGYLPDGDVTGFSLMHESGTGGAPKYGIVSQMPVLGAVDNPLADLSLERMGRDFGEVGYFRSWLKGGVEVEMAGTDHAAFFKYSFKGGGYENSIVVDVSHVLKSFRGLGWSQEYVKGKFQIYDDGHYEGFGVYKGGWNLAPNFNVYFCGYFDTPPNMAATFSGVGEKLHQMGEQSFVQGAERLGGVFTFRERPIVSRVGVSWISSTRACMHVNNEIPANTTLPTLTEQSRNRWNNEVLSKIKTNPDALSEHLRQLYSNMYAMYIIPTNRTGENPKWKSAEPYYDDIVTYWDLFRCSVSLTHILTPQAHQEQLRSLIDIWRHEGWLPDARSSDWTGETQGGSNTDNVLADAFVKGVDLNWTAAYEAMLVNAEEVPPNNRDPRAPDSSTRFGRGALSDWKEHGYITPKFSRAVSRAVEYAENDFGLYEVAKGLGKPDEEVDRYLKRSRNWRNHWNSEQKSMGFSGFLVPRHENGSFEYPYDPLQCGDCYWMDPYYEALPWEYTFAAGHHDMAYFVNATGGKATMIRKLQRIFEQWMYKPNEAFNETILNPSNEPSFTTPYLFHYVDRQDLSVKYSRRTAQFFYDPGREGLPGNSDSGAMQSWQLWNMIGLYPMVGQRTFLLGSPWFKYMKIDLGGKKSLEITQKGGSVNMEVYYVQRVIVNGYNWDQNWVDWGDVFENGGTIHFDLSHKPIMWATGDLPPSPASEDDYVFPEEEN